MIYPLARKNKEYLFYFVLFSKCNKAFISITFNCMFNIKQVSRTNNEMDAGIFYLGKDNPHSDMETVKINQDSESA